VDTPWHGYSGPSDRGLEGAFMVISRLFIPDGLEDMRARSGMFVGVPKAQTFARRAGLYGVPLPDHFEVRMLFAEQPGVVLRPGQSSLAQLADKLVQYYSRETPVRGDARMMNYWRALISSSQYFAFQDDMRHAADRGLLDHAQTLALIQKHFPSFAGDHNSVLAAAGTGRRLLDHLATLLPDATPPSVMPATTGSLLASR